MNSSPERDAVIIKTPEQQERLTVLSTGNGLDRMKVLLLIGPFHWTKCWNNTTMRTFISPTEEFGSTFKSSRLWKMKEAEERSNPRETFKDLIFAAAWFISMTTTASKGNFYKSQCLTLKIKAKRSNTKPTFDMKCFCFLLSTGRNVRFSITELTWICLKQKFLSFLWDPSHPSSQSPSPPPASRLPALHLWPQPDQTHRSDWKETSWRRCGWNVDADRPQSLLGSQHQIRVELETQKCKTFQVFSNELCFSEAPPAVRVANCSLSCSLKQCRQLSPQHDGPGNTWDPHDYSPPTSEDWFFRGVRGWREVTPVRPSDAPCGSWSKTTPSITRTAWEILLEQRPDVLVKGLFTGRPIKKFQFFSVLRSISQSLQCFSEQ